VVSSAPQIDIQIVTKLMAARGISSFRAALELLKERTCTVDDKAMQITRKL
jgi:hypothetical protein